MAMMKSKYAYLKEITKQLYNMKTAEVSTELEGTTPPSVFIGSYNYPKVYAGPLLTSETNSEIMDQPESWINNHSTQKQIIDYRLNLVRGKQTIGIYDLENNYIEKLQEVSMASRSILSEAEFNKKPQGMMIGREESPHGPSGTLKKFDIENVKWDHQLEKTYYDTDLKAADAVDILHKKDIPFSQIQKAFSVGSMGEAKNRKLVPTRWSITAVDTTIANKLLEDVKYYPTIDTYHVYEYESLGNYYAIVEIPTPWQFEAMEAFINYKGQKSMIFTDYENNKGKKGYSRLGGGYYAAKMAVTEQLCNDKKQAGVFVFREADETYIPLGVFNMRENIRYALRQKPHEFETLTKALEYVDSRLKLTVDEFRAAGDLLDDTVKQRQTTLDQFF